MSLQEQKSLNIQTQETRAYLRFCDKLFTASSIEDFLSLLYKETSRRFKIRSLVFYWHSGHFGFLQYVCHSKGIYKKSADYVWPDGKMNKDIRIKNKEDSRYLADFLGRPVQNILSIPVCTSQYGVNSPICIFVEFCVKNPDKLLCFYESFLTLITECLDRLLLQDHLKTSIELWTSTFNGLKEPLAIFDEKNNLSNSNNVFDMIFGSTDKNPLKQQTVQWKEQIFERHSYPVNITGSEYTTYHYVDISESLALRNQMIQNMKMSALGELGEAVAHQLNNPLTGVLSMAQLILCSNNLNTEMKKDMENIIEGISRSQEIISNLLDFSRADSQLYVCDLNEVVQKTLPFLKSMIRFSDFQFKLCEKPVSVKVQAGLLQQVVFNLVKNACQAVSEVTDSVRQVKICVCQVEDQAVLFVEDNGRGIKSTDYENVFKPFFTTKSKTKGTGLGLNMSRSIVESFKGNLIAGRSALGGACFTMSLPLEY